MKNKEVVESRVIRTFTGKWIDVYNIDYSDIDIKDIAHSLSQIPRFTGHLKYHYSVAQHSIWCAEQALMDENTPNRLAYDALLHDASEAYINDLARPYKHTLKDYMLLEEKVMEVIARSLNFEYPMNPLVKKIDDKAANVEWDALMIGQVKASDKSMEEVETDFLRMYEQLKPK